jgi:uncharacterized damage-inducible protein DinB
MTTATKSPVIAPIAMTFLFNDNLAFRALEGLTQEELWRAPTDRNNAMLWVAGHVVQTRATVLGQLGEPVDTGWGDLFERGAKVHDAKRYPERDEIERVMRDVASRIQRKLASLEDEYLAGPATMELPNATTMADQLAFFALHDSYHVGQMAYIRKSLGYPGIAG